MDENSGKDKGSWVAIQNRRGEALLAGDITPEKYALWGLGYTVTQYSGKIPKETFTKPVNPQKKNKATTGSHNQIYVEPSEPVCYKTRIANGDDQSMSKTHTSASDLPGYIGEGIFLQKMAQHRLAGIPKFIGFVELPDKRMSVAQQYIPDTEGIPIRYSRRMNGLPSETIYSIFDALEPVAKTIDTIYRLGGGVNMTEISANMRMVMNGERVSDIWIVDFEGYSNPTRDIPDTEMATLREGLWGFSVMVFDLLHEAIESRPENNEKTDNHEAIDYLKFVMLHGVNKSGWT